MRQWILAVGVSPPPTKRTKRRNSKMWLTRRRQRRARQSCQPSQIKLKRTVGAHGGPRRIRRKARRQLKKISLLCHLRRRPSPKMLKRTVGAHGGLRRTKRKARR